MIKRWVHCITVGIRKDERTCIQAVMLLQIILRG